MGDPKQVGDEVLIRGRMSTEIGVIVKVTPSGRMDVQTAYSLNPTQPTRTYRYNSKGRLLGGGYYAAYIDMRATPERLAEVRLALRAGKALRHIAHQLRRRLESGKVRKYTPEEVDRIEHLTTELLPYITLRT